MKRWRIGMVGYGWAAGAHLGALDLIDRFEVAAIFTSRSLSADTRSTVSISCVVTTTSITGWR